MRRNAEISIFTGWLALAALALSPAALAANEIYTWTDEDGSVHFSDSPRADGEMQVIEAEEAYRPGTADAYAQPPAAEPNVDPAAEPPAGPVAESPAMPSAAEARREQLRAESQERREARAENERLCRLHRERLERMEPARRVFYRDEQGQEVRMDDDQRVALVEEDQAFLDKNCR